LELRFPADFLINSGLIDLNWQQIYHPNALSSIYLGFPEQPDESSEFDDAQAVVAIHSEAVIVREPVMEYGLTIRPQRVEVSVILSDSTGKPRIVNGSFSPTDYRCYLRYISFENDEMFAQEVLGFALRRSLKSGFLGICRRLRRG